jgi:hypothetical protein
MIKNASSARRGANSRFAFTSFRSCKRLAAFTAVTAAMLTASVSQAAIFSYINQFGSSVTFTNISENTHADPNPLFGAPTVSGDTLDFSPNNFFAAVQPGPGGDLTDGLLKFRGVSLPGFAMENIKFAEGGAFSTTGFGTNATFVDVGAVGFIDVFEVDNVLINKVTIPIGLTFSFGSNGAQNDGKWRLGTEGFANGNLWTGMQLIDIKQELINRGVPVVNGATLIDVVIDNSLYAQAESNLTNALIDKKDFFTVTVNVPEPASCLLAIFGLVAGVMVSRRSR